MDATGVLVAAAAVVFLFLWIAKSHQEKGSRTIPGPAKLPIIGNVLQVGSWFHLRFSEWSKIYGPLFRVYMGNWQWVIVTDAKLIKQLFNEPASTGRIAQNPVFAEIFKGANGVINSEGEVWEVQRRFAVKTLQTYNYIKTSSEGVILDEVNAMLNVFRKNSKVPMSGNKIFFPPIVCILWRVITGERIYWEDSNPKAVSVLLDFLECKDEVINNGLLIAPVLRFVAPNYFGWNRFKAATAAMFEVVEGTIAQHRNTFDPAHLRDVIDHYIHEIEKTTDPLSSFYKNKGEDNLKTVIYDMFIAGVETTGTVIATAILSLSHHKDVQAKLAREIDDVLGLRMPSLTDKPSLPYTEAVVLEALRYSSVAGLGAPHQATDDFMFQGYKIKKGTCIVANNYGVHFNENIWGDPKIFRPDRFLIDGKVVRPEALVPFAEGKRKCIGEKLAQNIIFLFIASMFQQFRFHLELAPGQQPDFEHLSGFVLYPKEFKFVVHPRF